MGKNFSRNQKRENRNEADFYQTPYCLTKALLEYFSQREIDLSNLYLDKIRIADYCCGKHAIGQVVSSFLKEKNILNVFLLETDLNKGVDFLNIKTMGENKFHFGIRPEIGIMNPPFKLFNKWVEKCFEVFTVGFALLAPTTYLQGISRFNKNGTGIFQNKNYPLTHVLTFNRYPMLSAELREDGKIETGMQALSWFIFQRGKANITLHDWLDIDEYVLRKRDK